MSQLETVRKTLSYAWELNGTKTKSETNWPCVASMFESTIRPGLLVPNRKNGALAKRIPTPRQLKTAINTGWLPSNTMPLLKWCVHYMCFWDTMVCGARARIDLNKIKKSKIHAVDYKQGWQNSAFLGGRSKLTGAKKGTRPWSMWRISERCEPLDCTVPTSDLTLRKLSMN